LPDIVPVSGQPLLISPRSRLTATTKTGLAERWVVAGNPSVALAPSELSTAAEADR